MSLHAQRRKDLAFAFCRAFTFEDQVRSSSAAALEALQQGSWRTSGPSRWLGWLPILGRLFKDGPRLADALNVMMLTGDNVASACSIAGMCLQRVSCRLSMGRTTFHLVTSVS